MVFFLNVPQCNKFVHTPTLLLNVHRWVLSALEQCTKITSFKLLMPTQCSSTVTIWPDFSNAKNCLPPYPWHGHKTKILLTTVESMSRHISVESLWICSEILNYFNDPFIWRKVSWLFQMDWSFCLLHKTYFSSNKPVPCRCTPLSMCFRDKYASNTIENFYISIAFAVAFLPSNRPVQLFVNLYVNWANIYFFAAKFLEIVPSFDTISSYMCLMHRKVLWIHPSKPQSFEYYFVLLFQLDHHWMNTLICDISGQRVNKVESQAIHHTSIPFQKKNPN